MQVENDNCIALTFISDTQDSLFHEMSDWLEVELMTGWTDVELISITFSEIEENHQAVLTCKVTQNEDAFDTDDEDDED